MSEIIQLKNPLTGELQYPLAFAQGGVKRDLLWSNPSPTSTFASQTINVDTTPYDYFIISLWGIGGLADRVYENYTIFRDDTVIRIKMRTGDDRWCSRSLSITNSGFTFGQQELLSNNDYCIPQKIYGIKTSYLVPTEVHGLTYIDDDTNGNITLYNNDGTKALYPKGQLVGIDFTRVLATATNVRIKNSPMTAPEDGWLYIYYSSTNSGTDTITIDGNGIQPANANVNYIGWYPMKKGQVLSATYTDVILRYTFYGLKH